MSLSSFGGTSTDGCFDVNKNFTNFTAGAGSSNSVGVADPTTANIDFLAGGTQADTTATFSTPTGTQWFNTAVSKTQDSEFSYLEQADPVTTYALTLSLTGLTRGTQDTITVDETFCLNATTLVGCSAANKGELEVTDTFAGVVASVITTPTGAKSCVSGTTACIAFSTASEIFIQTDVILITGSQGNTASLTSLTEGFETPEPSTFVLLGTALSGLGFMRLRRKKA